MSAGLERYTHAVPVAAERLLLEMVNDVTALARDRVEAERNEGFFGRLLSAVTGRSRKRRLDAVSALTHGQAATQAWVSTVVERAAQTDLALEHTAWVLRNLQYEVAEARAVGRQALDSVRELWGAVAEMARIIDSRLTELGARVGDLEARVADHDWILMVNNVWRRGWTASDRAIFRWERAGAYGHLPWIYQVTLLSSETYGTAAGTYEYLTADTGLRLRLTDHVLADPRLQQAWPGRADLADVIDAAVTSVPSLDERAMLGELLGDRLSPRLRRAGGGVTTALRWGMVLGARPEHLRPTHLGVEAVHQALATGYFPQAMTGAEFATLAIGEQADAAVRLWTDIHGHPGSARATAEAPGGPPDTAPADSAGTVGEDVPT
jgi:hypothetical protein